MNSTYRDGFLSSSVQSDNDRHLFVLLDSSGGQLRILVLSDKEGLLLLPSDSEGGGGLIR